MKTLSIIIPCFNSGKTIISTIDSLNEQSFRCFEVIFVDGDSSDDTLLLIKNNCNFSYSVISEPDHGIYDAMNKGVKKAAGDWIYIMGSDDRLFNKDALREISPLFSSSDFIYSSLVTNFYKNGKLIKFNLPEKVSKKFNNAPPFFHQAVFIKKDIISFLGGFNMEYKVHSDFDLIIRAFKIAKKITRSDVILCHYNALGFSGIKKDTFIENNKEFKKILKKNNALNLSWRLRLLKKYYYFLRIILKNYGKK